MQVCMYIILNKYQHTSISPHGLALLAAESETRFASRLACALDNRIIETVLIHYRQHVHVL